MKKTCDVVEECYKHKWKTIKKKEQINKKNKKSGRGTSTKRRYSGVGSRGPIWNGLYVPWMKNNFKGSSLLSIANVLRETDGVLVGSFNTKSG